MTYLGDDNLGRAFRHVLLGMEATRARQRHTGLHLGDTVAGQGRKGTHICISPDVEVQVLKPQSLFQELLTSQHGKERVSRPDGGRVTGLAITYRRELCEAGDLDSWQIQQSTHTLDTGVFRPASHQSRERAIIRPHDGTAGNSLISDAHIDTLAYTQFTRRIGNALRCLVCIHGNEFRPHCHHGGNLGRRNVLNVPDVAERETVAMDPMRLQRLDRACGRNSRIQKYASHEGVQPILFCHGKYTQTVRGRGFCGQPRVAGNHVQIDQLSSRRQRAGLMQLDGGGQHAGVAVESTLKQRSHEDILRSHGGLNILVLKGFRH